ncbi:hypothetical protein Swol_2511 [Syntrophomonas wolfei subsp. wolfei str. Goettingen G311]|uniref:Uncharacterized protein n=1 Tax=Syntrophomonas wolfei subsp. wolfei (strain DSM 2245B / Goettingen) TaxID=335541 RepID=Q0AU04_SYNWW|nr:hypothetical protein Swol_2511 [Syntrophomonas wolfei subsp. wolfei str. Goettingen G311]
MSTRWFQSPIRGSQTLRVAQKTWPDEMFQSPIRGSQTKANSQNIKLMLWFQSPIRGSQTMKFFCQSDCSILSFNPLYAGHKLKQCAFAYPLGSKFQSPIRGSQTKFTVRGRAGPVHVSIPYTRVTNERGKVFPWYGFRVSIPYTRVTNDKVKPTHIYDFLFQSPIRGSQTV